ncbi:phosphotransferase [Calidifontibacter sp. DB0510]|uniref:Phosphotransferase n=1 Tax=Metallococcus carri TaxID=1656884 RepID=A0A967B7U8_9MICO|nr:phosphotransferase [Metallococcus carri]NHN57192.1 phosphotransferase [Metallococcus carri]NOP38005.1 phosphotransferase [Calidifontibacter sp. DB2511S]
MGIDERGREILTFIDGEVATRPWPAWVADDERATSVARLLRRLDDALIPFGLPPGSPNRKERPTLAARPGPAATFIGHRDVTPENTVFRDGVAVALIDFDLARPSSRVDEVANLLLWWGGWLAPKDRDAVLYDVDPASRGRLLVDAYGLGGDERRWIVPVSIAIAGRSWHSMRERAATHGGGWARMWDNGSVTSSNDASSGCATTRTSCTGL